MGNRRGRVIAGRAVGVGGGGGAGEEGGGRVEGELGEG